MTKVHNLDTEAHKSQEFRENIARGYAQVRVAVHGYWSYESITLRVNRDWSGQGWKIELSHSSGGRDPKVVASDLEAEANFGQALIDTAKYGEYLKTLIPEFDAVYKAHADELRKQHLAEQEAKKARVEADPGMFAEQIRFVMSKMYEDPDLVVTTFDRGTDFARRISLKLTRGGTRQFFEGSRRLTKDKMVEFMKTLSSNRVKMENYANQWK